LTILGIDPGSRIMGYAVVEAEVRREDVLVARSSGKFFYQARTEPAP